MFLDVRRSQEEVDQDILTYVRDESTMIIGRDIYKWTEEKLPYLYKPPFDDFRMGVAEGGKGLDKYEPWRRRKVEYPGL